MFSSHIFWNGLSSHQSASHGRVVRAGRSVVGGAGRERQRAREAVNRQPRNFDGGQISDLD